jgi:MFS family permease
VTALALGFAFGGMGVAVPAYATAYVEHDPEGVGGLLLGVWGIGSAVSGIYFGTRPPGRLGWLLGGVAASILVLAAMPSALALGIALVVGGATIAPALTVQNSLVGQIVPGSMLNEAYTWLVTVSVASSAAGVAAMGLVVDRSGGVVWAFLLAGTAVGFGALVAANPRGAIARAATQASPV